MPQDPRDTVADDGAPDRLTDRDPYPGLALSALGIHASIYDDGTTTHLLATTNGPSEFIGAREPVGRGQHVRKPRSRLGRKPSAALRAPARQDGTSGAGAHPSPETVLAGTTPVIGLEGALHDVLLGKTDR